MGGGEDTTDQTFQRAGATLAVRYEDTETVIGLHTQRLTGAGSRATGWPDARAQFSLGKRIVRQSSDSDAVTAARA